MFGVDADDVPRLREERKNFKDYDPRWTAVMDLLLSGKFGDKEYFQVSCAPLAALPSVQQLDGAPSCHRMPLCSATLHCCTAPCMCVPCAPARSSQKYR